MREEQQASAVLGAVGSRPASPALPGAGEAAEHTRAAADDEGALAGLSGGGNVGVLPRASAAVSAGAEKAPAATARQILHQQGVDPPAVEQPAGAVACEQRHAHAHFTTFIYTGLRACVLCGDWTAVILVRLACIHGASGGVVSLDRSLPLRLGIFCLLPGLSAHPSPNTLGAPAATAEPHYYTPTTMHHGNGAQVCY